MEPTNADNYRQDFELAKSQNRPIGAVKEKINKTLEHRFKLFTNRNTKSGIFVFQNDKKGDVVKKEHENGQKRVPKRERWWNRRERATEWQRNSAGTSPNPISVNPAGHVI